MINAATITTAIVTALEGHSALSALSPTITRADTLEDAVTVSPWIGVFKTEVEYDPRTLGRNPTQWEARITCRVIAQVVSLFTGEDAEDTLEAIVQAIMDALTNDHTLATQVDILVRATVTYLMAPDDPQGQYSQAADILLIWEVSTS